jgi:peptide/nickel transport system permease protein
MPAGFRLLGIATWSRFMRSSMLEVIRTDYMRTAAAKGLNRARSFSVTD